LALGLGSLGTLGLGSTLGSLGIGIGLLGPLGLGPLGALGTLALVLVLLVLLAFVLLVRTPPVERMAPYAAFQNILFFFRNL
jgi:hypothetical protein